MSKPMSGLVFELGLERSDLGGGGGGGVILGISYALRLWTGQTPAACLQVDARRADANRQVLFYAR